VAHRAGLPLSLKTVLMLADQMLSRIEFLHRKGFLHRDLKPENFVFGRGSQHRVLHLIDFGLSCRYCDQRTSLHCAYGNSDRIVGTARYISVNAHLGVRSSRRDDLESIGYIIVWLLKGRLPWQGVAGESRAAKYHAIGRMKMTTPLRVICDGLPDEFGLFLEHVRGLRFDDEPDYAFYRRMFRKLFISEGFLFDDEYDWP
jgi:serine/threonine protein kinase